MYNAYEIGSLFALCINSLHCPNSCVCCLNVVVQLFCVFFISKIYMSFSLHHINSRNHTIWRISQNYNKLELNVTFILHLDANLSLNFMFFLIWSWKVSVYFKICTWTHKTNQPPKLLHFFESYFNHPNFFPKRDHKTVLNHKIVLSPFAISIWIHWALSLQHKRQNYSELFVTAANVVVEVLQLQVVTLDVHLINIVVVIVSVTYQPCDVTSRDVGGIAHGAGDVLHAF